MTPAVVVAARTASRWRCGVEHTSTPQTWPAGSWTDAQLERLRADPMLTVVDAEPAPAAGVHPTTPTVQAALDTALEALRQATGDESLGFVERMRDDPEIGPKITVAAEAASGVPQEDKPDRAALIVAAITRLDLDVKSNVTKAGVPTVEALEALLEFDITAAERDEAWAAFKDAG